MRLLGSCALLLSFALLTPSAFAAKSSGDDKLLLDYLMSQAVQTGDSDARRALIEQELALQKALLAESKRLGLLERDGVEARMELARRQVIVEAYWEDFFKRNPISEADIKSLYEELREANGKQQYRLSQIVVQDDAAAREVLTALKEKQSFSELAKTHSKEPSTGAQGGDMGWRWKTDLIPPVRRALDFLKPEEYTTTPIGIPGGLVIVRLDEMRDQAFPKLETLKDELENALRQRAKQQELARLQAQKN